MPFKIGDVVYAHIAYEDGTGTKPRPVIIYKVIPEKDRYAVVECYSDKEHYDRSKGRLIKEDTQLYKEMGLRWPSIVTLNQKAIYGKMILEHWGYYSPINDLIETLKKMSQK